MIIYATVTLGTNDTATTDPVTMAAAFLTAAGGDPAVDTCTVNITGSGVAGVTPATAAALAEVQPA